MTSLTPGEGTRLSTKHFIRIPGTAHAAFPSGSFLRMSTVSAGSVRRV